MKKFVLLAALAACTGGTAWAQCPTGEVPVTVSISTDAYGSETTWTLTGPGGSPSYASGGPYSIQSSGGAYVQTPVTTCIPIGSTVVFTINDQYGDGMCCSYGEGHYEVSVNGCSVVAEGGEFGDSESATFTTAAAATVDLAITNLSMAELVPAGSVMITGSLQNVGANAINSYDLNYSVDGGATVTQTVSTPIASCSSIDFTHSIPWNATTGNHAVSVWVSNVNSGTDEVAGNDEMEMDISVATQSVQRTALMEEFTSSTCWPCANLNVTFDPLLTSMQANQDGSQLAAVKYQMNWPSPGNDPSYNPDGNTRRGYYGVSGIPDPYIDGKAMNWPPNASQMNAATAVPAFVSLDVSYTLTGTTVDVTAHVTPHFDGTGYKAYIAIIEDYYSYPGAATSQDDYHFAMRKMLPSAQGNLLTFVADEQQTLSESYALVEGGPAQGNYHLWGTVADISVVVFVQNNSTKQVMQAAFAMEPAVGIGEHQANDLLSIWPNPAKDQLNLRYGQSLSSPATVDVFNALGERVLTVQRNFATPGQVETIQLGDLQPGMYLVRLVADGVTSTQRISVSK